MILGMLYFFIHPGIFISKVGHSPLYFMIHYKWNISKKRENKISAVLTCRKKHFYLNIKGIGLMYDFLDAPKKIAWHQLQNPTVGWLFSLEKLNIGDGITNIGDCAFANCIALKQVLLPASLQKIGTHAFGNCTSLSEITYSGSMYSWDNIKLDNNWNQGNSIKQIICNDGVIHLYDNQQSE